MDKFCFPGMVRLMSTLSEIVDRIYPKSDLSISELEDLLDPMTHEERVGWIRNQNLVDQMRLWNLAAGRGVTLEHLVPTSCAPGVEVIHEGKNTLPVFSAFQKRFVRDIEQPSVIYGYNEGATRHVIGPGYFVAEFDELRSEVGVNYYRVPPSSARLPVNWPEVKTNEEGLQKFVFSTMVDYLRRLSSHVCIGRAYKASQETHNYFLLVRQD